MDRPPSAPAEGAPPASRGFLICAACLVALFVWHAWMTLSLFGRDAPLDGLLDDHAVVSGKHPQHFYFGIVGAQALGAGTGSSCYDPAFDAAYPKTPIFNGGRFAEIFVWIAGGGYEPAAYKLGLAALCLLVPVLVVVAAGGIGLGGPPTLFATAAALLVWWGQPAQDALHSGDFELLFASLAILAHVGMLVRFDRIPGLLSWLGLLFTGTLGWFAQPMVLPLLLLLFLIYYLTTGVRHRTPLWHLALWGSELACVGLNSWWLIDWVSFWWLRSSLPTPTTMLAHRTIATFWGCPLWGGPGDRLVAVALLASAIPGVWIFQANHERAAARVLGLGTAILFLLTLLGISWEPLGQMGTCGLLVPALWFAAIPAAHAWMSAFRGLRYLMGGPARALLVAAAVLIVLALLLPGHVAAVGERCVVAPAFELGLEQDQESLIETLIQYTGPEARILWEDRSPPRRWAPLLPLFTGRSFIGGLDPDQTIEHASIGLTGDRLLDPDRPLGLWTDSALDDYCRRYNVGWVACWSPNVVARMQAWKSATLVAELHDQGKGYLFKVRRERPSLVLKGQADVLHADSHHITLADVVPENGVVVLSLHYQKNLRASPSRVHIERETDASDPIGFLRLRVAGRVSWVTLTWDNR
jgi:hypothetical protein